MAHVGRVTRFLAWLAALLALSACASAPAERGRVLIFSHTTGYRHASIAPGIAALREVATQQGLAADASEDPALFDRAERLARYDAIVLLHTTTDPKRPESEWLVGPRRAALQAYLRGGGGIVGVHAAADSHYGWNWYGRMIGGRFRSHPEGTPRGVLTRQGAAHPATADLPPRFERVDEWYAYDGFDARITPPLLTVDARAFGGGPADPIAWAHRFEGGRRLSLLFRSPGLAPPSATIMLVRHGSAPLLHCNIAA